MPPSIWNIQWSNQNSQRSYPLADWGTCTDKSGTIRIPDSFLLALYLPIHAGMNVQPERFYLQALGIYPVGYSIVIGYNDGSANPPTVASANITTVGHTPGRTYAVSGSGDFDDTVGQVMIGPLDEISRLPTGVYY